MKRVECEGIELVEERETRLGWSEEAPAENGRPADSFVKRRWVSEWEVMDEAAPAIADVR